MTTGLEHLEYRQLRAPKESGAALIDPPLEQVSELVAQNRRASQRCDYDFQGRSLAELARQARSELVAEAVHWTSQYRDVEAKALAPARSLFLAGHQPQLFHPGVWLKNLALGTLARRHEALGINLIIDSDTIKNASLRVPGGSAAHPHLAAVAVDESGPAIPYEERPILDRGLFESFGRRAVEEIRPLVRHPLLESFWPMVVARSQATNNFGACLAQARHQLEGRWGSPTLEVPQSRVCDLPSFAWFTAHLLAHLPRLRLVYNDVVAEYRRTHHIRSTAHPVPDLAAEGNWLEAPFWIWTADQPRRRRLFACQRDDEIVFTNRAGLEASLPLTPEGDAQAAAERLIEVGRQGIKIRSRALVTTLWARLVLSDLFLHGIGGAKYDQVTDALMSQFFGLQPPRYLVVSATLHLPIPHQVPSDEDLRRIDRRLRDLTYHPERIFEESQSVEPSHDGPAELIEAKRHWIRTPQTPENAATRFQEFHRINAALQPWVAAERRRLLEHRQRLEAALRNESILSSREYAFCLYPEEMLRREFARLLP
jgi:hypothetical protein